jgi:hypothetical protein
MTKKFEIAGLTAAGCLWGYIAGAQLDWCDRGEICRAVLPELPHGQHHDPHPWQPLQQLQNGSTSSSSAGTTSLDAGSLRLTIT